MAQYELLVRSEFSAAHRLRLVDGSMEPLHGHNWRVEVYIEGDDLDSIGVLADFTFLEPRLKDVTDGLHNRLLNDLPAFAGKNPSTERVAQHIHDRLEPLLEAGIRISKVRVWETRNCAAAYIPGPRA